MTLVKKSTRHAYDTEADDWYTFETEQQLDDYIAKAASETTDYIDEDRGDSNLFAMTIPFPTLGSPNMLTTRDPERGEVVFKFDDPAATNPLLSYVTIGRKEQLQNSNPSGYRLYSGQNVKLDVQSEVWAVTSAASSVSAVVSIIGTTLLP